MYCTGGRSPEGHESEQEKDTGTLNPRKVKDSGGPGR